MSSDVLCAAYQYPFVGYSSCANHLPVLRKVDVALSERVTNVGLILEKKSATSVNFIQQRQFLQLSSSATCKMRNTHRRRWCRGLDAISMFVAEQDEENPKTGRFTGKKNRKGKDSLTRTLQRHYVPILHPLKSTQRAVYVSVCSTTDV